MADYHEEQTLTEGFRKGENKDKNDYHKTIQEPQENSEKRYMLKKGREARRNDSGLKHKTSLLNILFALNSCVVACLYVKRAAQQHSICSLFNSGVSLCFVNAKLQNFLLFQNILKRTLRVKEYEQMLD